MLLRGNIFEQDNSWAAGAVVTVSEVDELGAGAVIATAVTDARGQFAIPLASQRRVPDRMVVMARHQNRYAAMWLVAPESSISMPLWAVGSVVVRVEGAGRAPEFDVTFEPLERPPFSWSNPPRQRFRGDRFVVKDVPATRVRVVVATPSYRLVGETEVVVSATGTTDALVVVKPRRAGAD